jgi:hypothetical protein
MWGVSCSHNEHWEQVFIPEQQVYSKQDLERHLRTGDLVGPLADTGFKGHPQCRFCRKRFYGDGELFLHMQAGAACLECPSVDACCVHRPAQSTTLWIHVHPHRTNLAAALGCWLLSGKGNGQLSLVKDKSEGKSSRAMPSHTGCGGADLGGFVPAAQSAHEQCFLCRRARPDRYVYYRDYAELEGDLVSLAHLADSPEWGITFSLASANNPLSALL